MMALSPACRCTSVKSTSGLSVSKAPSPLTGGNWPGSPSTRVGLPKARRSRAISAPTMETSSSTSSLASRRTNSELSTKRGLWTSFSRSSSERRREFLEQALGNTERWQLRLDFGDFGLELFDLLRARLRDAIDQRMDGGCGRTLARHHQGGLAGEGGIEHVAGLRAGFGGGQPQFVDRILDDGALADPGIAEDAAHLLFAV